MLSLKQLKAFQEFMSRWFNTPVTIYNRANAPVSTDFGDDQVAYSGNGVVAMGWLLTTPTPAFTTDVGQVITANTYKLRVKVGTRVEPGARVVIGGENYTVVDVTNEASWPEWTICALRRIQ